MSSYAIRPLNSADIPELIAVWKRSVEATHTFLEKEDVAFFLPHVRQAMETLGVWVGEKDGELAGFLIMDDDSVEALFVDPPHIGKGLGSMFLRHAEATRHAGGCLRVDANEQNPDAVAFYRSRGFVETGRSPVDKSGRPFPLVHLVLPRGNPTPEK